MTAAVQLLATPVFQAPSTIRTALALRLANLAVPTSEQEQQPSVVRCWEQLMRDRRRAEARGRALLIIQAILVPRGWWRPALWPDFSRGLPPVNDPRRWNTARLWAADA